MKNLSVINILLRIAEESKKAINGELTDVAHYAHAILARHRFEDIRISNDTGKKIVEHLHSAIRLSQFPLALLELGNLYRLGVDPALSAEQSQSEAYKYYQQAAEQGIQSAQKFLEHSKKKGLFEAGSSSTDQKSSVVNSQVKFEK